MTDIIRSSQANENSSEAITSSQAISSSQLIPSSQSTDPAKEKAELERIKQREHHRKIFQKYLDDPHSDNRRRRNTL
ncbi:unnamed protein product [Brachionus calyciflorus]|uniref:Uncharacterized protein n=1 Tax=Brachionus calyciflorus TaxID=104777 RepID=A0A814D1R2_9BILA|nr:unnamed protein product [Brachionus calyciflorus]